MLNRRDGAASGLCRLEPSYGCGRRRWRGLTSVWHVRSRRGHAPDVALPACVKMGRWELLGADQHRHSWVYSQTTDASATSSEAGQRELSQEPHPRPDVSEAHGILREARSAAEAQRAYREHIWLCNESAAALGVVPSCVGVGGTWSADCSRFPRVASQRSQARREVTGSGSLRSVRRLPLPIVRMASSS